MEQIIKNLENPEWWFTGIFFALFGVVLAKLVFAWIPAFWNKMSKIFPALLNKLNRRREKKSQLTIKKYRQHSVNVFWLISRYWALATIMCIYGIFAFVMFVTSSFSNDQAYQTTSFALIVPFYILGFFVIREKKLTKRVVKEHLIWQKRITNKSTKGL